jgi:hypothetical protein
MSDAVGSAPIGTSAYAIVAPSEATDVCSEFMQSSPHPQPVAAICDPNSHHDDHQVLAKHEADHRRLEAGDGSQIEHLTGIEALQHQLVRHQPQTQSSSRGGAQSAAGSTVTTE